MRKLGHATDAYSTRTMTEYYPRFLMAILDEMGKYFEMKGDCLMDYAHTHSSMDIRKYVHSRGYQCVYLTLYFPELNPIGQFCSVDKDKVKRNKFLEKESLMTRISEACDVLYLSEFKYIVSYSTKCFGECLYKERLYSMSTPGSNSIGSLF